MVEGIAVGPSSLQPQGGPGKKVVEHSWDCRLVPVSTCSIEIRESLYIPGGGTA